MQKGLPLKQIQPASARRRETLKVGAGAEKGSLRGELGGEVQPKEQCLERSAHLAGRAAGPHSALISGDFGFGSLPG